MIIVDDHTGRTTFRAAAGPTVLHQAVEAKEGVEIQNENQTLAPITFQNYFRLYEKLARDDRCRRYRSLEFSSIYNWTPSWCQPTSGDPYDMPDLVYMTEKKIGAIIEDIRERTGQPVLVGTISIENQRFMS